MTDFVFPDVTFVDANTHEEVTCGFDTLHNVAEPDAWGMVRFHPHAPVELLYPPAPQYVHELEGVAQDAVLGVLAKTVKPGLAAGLEAIVDKLSDGSNRLEYPPGQRGNPLPVSEVVRQEYERMFPQDDETNVYRMQVYTWRLSDVIRVCKRLLLDPDAIFRTQTSSPEPSRFLNFAGDSYYGDDIRLREPNCEPLLSDAIMVGEGKYRVFRKAPGHHPRDRPATYHNNYSEVAGAPDPLHDFGIKHWRNDAGQAAQFRYACCWQAPGSPGCLITYPSQKVSQTTRNDQGGLERVAGLPVLYQWFGGFAPTAQTAKFRGAAFLDREYADLLHEKITASLTDALVQKIATRAQLSASETRVVAQIAVWMHQYNAPLLGCALNMPPEEITMGNVEEYLDRVVKDRGVLQKVVSKEPPRVFVVPLEILDLMEIAKRHGLTVIEKDLETLRQASQKGREVQQVQIDQQRARIVDTVPLERVSPFGRAVDARDQWIIDAKRKATDKRVFDRLLLMLRYNPVAGERAVLIRAFDSNNQVLLQKLLDDYSLDQNFAETLKTGQWKSLKPDDPYFQMLLSSAGKISDVPFFKQEDLHVVARLAFKKFVRRPQEAEESEKMLQNYIQTTALTQTFPRAVEDMLRMLRSGTQFSVEEFNRRKDYLLGFVPTMKTLMLFPEEFARKWTPATTTQTSDTEGSYVIPQQQPLYLSRLREFLVELMEGVRQPTETWREAMRKKWTDLQALRTDALKKQRKANEVEEWDRLTREYEKNLRAYYATYREATVVADKDMVIQGQSAVFTKMWELINHLPEDLRHFWTYAFNFETLPEGEDGPTVPVNAIRFLPTKEAEPTSFEDVYAYSERQPNQVKFTLIYPLTEAWIAAHIASLAFMKSFIQEVYVKGIVDEKRLDQLRGVFKTIETDLRQAVKKK